MSGMSSRERLDMDDTKVAGHSLSFKQRKGCFLERWVLGLILLLGIGIVVAVGLLVGFFGPCHKNGQLSDDDTGEDEKVQKPRPYVLLPRSVVPEEYSIELQPFLTPGNFTFNGRSSVLIRCTESTTNISIHAKEITVHSYSLEQAGGKAPRVSSTSEDKERDFFILHLDTPLLQDNTYLLSFNYTGILNDELAGFYRSSYKDSSNETRWLATTQFQPTDARLAFPCFDEPALKATFNITIIRWNNMSSLSNMPIGRQESRGDNWTADIYKTTLKMSTYLLAFIVSDYTSIGDEKFKVWTRPEANETAKYALEIGTKVLGFYEEFFNISYPLPKMDMIAIPDFNAGAMENWGLITYRETALLYDKRVSSVHNKQRVATIISHEIAHQWFGNLVTPKWWDDLWLNEGFASYVEYLGVEHVQPTWGMGQQFVVDELQDVMELDSLKTSHPISVPVGHPDEINEIFDRISYAKGATVLRMMQYFLGNTTFKEGLTNYLNSKKYDSAVQDDLWEFLTNAQKEAPEKINVKRVMDSWTLQTGYPVVSVIRDYNAGKASLSQSRFLLDKTGDNSSTVWEIPITYTDENESNWHPVTKLWLNKHNGAISNITGSDKWIILNLQQVGYYRVNYDDQNWKLLVTQLQKDHTKIHVINRAQILDDLMDLARAGYVSYNLSLDATLYLINETEYLPWESALNTFGYLDTMLSRSAIYGKWKRYIVKQLTPLYNNLTWNARANESVLTQYMRINTLAWMCNFDYPDCVRTATSKFEEWRKDHTNLDIIPPNLRGVVYSTAIRNGSENEWQFIWERYLESKIASEKDKLMNALACAREPWLLSRYLDMAFDPSSGIRKQDGSYLFRRVSSNIYGRDIAFNYIRDKWKLVFKTYGKSSFAIGNMIKSVTSSLNTPFELLQLQEFKKLNMHNLGTSKRSLEQALESAKTNVRWMDTNFDNIKIWLDKQPDL